ncbi:bacitracin export permease protein BceB [Desulfosporosinus acididurans]|uniref:Bacitracin export permease protein BceB n=1 Tax=Desulfosporosinus acididurans TaxID=476652 RepID=A0A0J1FPP9_9FIRM|nr:ABC transporter permease [Desulfosporosinus acididurans]KLU65302.1 bacitracin export permease protein BceB [Desulfosporosinus acididurans]
MLISLARRNVKNNFENYFIYFSSIVFNVLIYFAFESISFNKQISALLQSNATILSIFRGASLIIAIFSAVQMLYSSSYFIRKRKKEVGLYSLLGLKKRQVGALLFFENIITGSLALIVGILLGGLFSKLFMMALVKFMGVNMDISFSISVNAVLNTAIVFGILFLLVSINAYAIIYRFRLIELFKAENKGEKQQKSSSFLAVLSLVLFIIEVCAVMNVTDSSTFTRNMPIVLISSIAGTFLFFRWFLAMIIKFLKNKKRLYYKGSNLISISHILFRIRSNSRNLSVIALLNAVVITSIGFGYAFHYNVEKLDKLQMPFSFYYESNNLSLDKSIEALLKKHPENKLIASEEAELVKVKADLSGISSRDQSIYLISQSKVEELDKFRGLRDDFKLSLSEGVILKDGTEPDSAYKDKIIKISNHELNSSIKIADRKNYAPMDVSDDHTLVLMVPDEVYKEYYNKADVVRIKGYVIENQRNSKALMKDIVRNIPNDVDFTYEAQNLGVLAISSVISFIGIFIGLVFLGATVSIIYFKQLTEANDDKERYGVLKKIGVGSSEIKKSIHKQVFIAFALPLLIGMFHSLTAFAFFSSIAPAMNVVLPALVTMIVYSLIYTVYYFLTVNSYLKIIG